MQLPDNLDPIYFAAESWDKRRERWIDQQQSKHGFARPNANAIQRMLDDPDTTAHMVVNLRTEPLLGLLASGQYKNIYDRPVVGGQRRQPSTTRLEVDRRLGIGKDHYFGAAAMGGAGVRYYGEYCLVLKRRVVDAETQVFDRDSYDILLEPLTRLTEEQVDTLKGRWGRDLPSMVLLKVLPRIDHDRQLVTSGTVSRLVLRDQEFIEVHLKRQFGPDDIDQVLESADSSALEARILHRQRIGLSNSMVELEWVRRRSEVAKRLEGRIRHRIVNADGRGYEWK